MSEDQMVTIEVDGRSLQAPAGAMLIEVTDAAGINIPRFCYHEKLSIAANCRMCLVEVERVPKPLPACATPVAEGMKVHTRSPLALAAQKGTMEFLLINHPLDCPICDQGGECELQDVAMGYGADVSRFVEGKRVVSDKDIGPLIATDFTRCIHCTRCVRFGAEIAGLRELGATGRGEHMHIGTYVEKSIDSELSGNVIDICPVGALTSKPFRYQARAWELVQRDAVAPHDAVGSNVHVHVRRGRVMRVHPRTNEAVNECWISDRDRFSYQGLYSGDRLLRPAVKRDDGAWVEVDWQDALNAAAEGLKGLPGDRLGVLASPVCTLEELHLAQKLGRALGSDNIDHRLRQADFRGDAGALTWLGSEIAALESLDAALLVGSQVRTEQPLLGHRLRKAALKGARITHLNPLAVDLNYAADQLVNTPDGMIDLSAIAAALGASGPLIDGVEPGTNHRAVAESLKGGGRSAVLLGALAIAHPDFSILRHLAGRIAEASGSSLGLLPPAANSVGALAAGVLPGAGGLNALEMVERPLRGYLLLGAEPDRDFLDPGTAQAALEAAECVVALSTYRTPALEAAADVLLPMAAFAETSGTFVNAAGRRQSFAGAVAPLGESRPGWKILRVLGNLLDREGFEQCSSEEVLAELGEAEGGAPAANRAEPLADDERRSRVGGLMRVGEVPLYATDPLVRRAEALQATGAAVEASLRLNPAALEQAGLVEGERARVVQGERRATLAVEADPRVPDGCVAIPAGVKGSEGLGPQFGEVTLEKA